MGLCEKKLKWKSHHIDLIPTGKYETLTVDYLKINPGAIVPTLLHNGTPIYESSHIIDYIDRQLPVKKKDKQSVFIPNEKQSQAVMKVKLTHVLLSIILCYISQSMQIEYVLIVLIVCVNV